MPSPSQNLNHVIFNLMANMICQRRPSLSLLELPDLLADVPLKLYELWA